MRPRFPIASALGFLWCVIAAIAPGWLFGANDDDGDVLRVFIFAGQSNMEGADSKVADISRFPPFAGLESPQEAVRFSYCLGRENKHRSDGWVALQPVRDMVGPELSFARRVSEVTGAPIAIIKCAAGGTHLGGDWNPDEPQGFEMYPLALDLVRSSLAELEREGIAYRLEGFLWHQGENDMFNDDYRADYGRNLANFLASWRRDLDCPDLRFYLGELCTKTIWGMDLRPRMYEISLGQKSVAKADPLADYIPTSQVGVEIGNPVGLHYHYGTLGQLQHGLAYAEAYLGTLGLAEKHDRPLDPWPYAPGSRVRLFVLAGHRNMEGERAFVQELEALPGGRELLRDREDIAFRYDLGGGYRVSDGWEPLGPTGYHDTFGPELSFARHLARGLGKENLAVAKFTHSGSQIIDWTPEGSMAEERNLYPKFLAFVREAVEDLEKRGHEVELEGIFYHLGENDMSFHPYRKAAPDRLAALVGQLRKDLDRPRLRWFVSQQPPTDVEKLNQVDVVAGIEAVAEADQDLVHLKLFDLPPQEKRLVLDTPAILEIGQAHAEAYLEP